MEAYPSESAEYDGENDPPRAPGIDGAAKDQAYEERADGSEEDGVADPVNAKNGVFPGAGLLVVQAKEYDHDNHGDASDRDVHYEDHQHRMCSLAWVHVR